MKLKESITSLNHWTNLNWVFLIASSSRKQGRKDSCYVKERFAQWNGDFGAGPHLQEFIFCCNSELPHHIDFSITEECYGAAGEIQSEVLEFYGQSHASV